jgi:uncharacterized SAM-binding protein YcdF (DUF218 family)
MDELRQHHVTPQETAAESLAVPSHPIRRFLLRVAGAGIALGILGFIGLGAYIDLYGQGDQAAPAHAIVVLGASVNAQGEPGDSLRARVLHAVELYERGFAPYLICTGGLGTYPPSEAAAAARLAIQCGIPERVIIQENASTSTWENATGTAKICRERGWRRVIIITDPYHLWRATRLFTRTGLDVHPSPAKGCIRYRDWRKRIRWTAREAMLVLREKTMGRF